MMKFLHTTIGLMTALAGLAVVLVTLMTVLITSNTVSVPIGPSDDPDPTEEFLDNGNIDIEGTWDFEDHIVDMFYDYTDEDGDDWYLFDSFALDGTETGTGTAIVSGDTLLILGTDFESGEYLREFILDEDDLPSFP